MSNMSFRPSSLFLAVGVLLSKSKPSGNSSVTVTPVSVPSPGLLTATS